MSLSAVVFVPHPPLLLAANAGAVDAGRELREQCRDVLARACAQAAPGVIVLLTGGGGARRDLKPLGVRVGRELLTAVARPGTGGGDSGGPKGPASPHLPAEALAGPDVVASPVVVTVPRDAGPEQIARAGAQVVRCCGSADRVLLLVVADGSARRDERSPGLPDERALAYDEALERAVREGDALALRALHVGGLDDELLIGGRAALQTAGWAVASAGASVAARGARLVDDFGVAYVIGWWTCASS